MYVSLNVLEMGERMKFKQPYGNEWQYVDIDIDYETMSAFDKEDFKNNPKLRGTF